jgi:hypothetical protein
VEREEKGTYSGAGTKASYRDVRHAMLEQSHLWKLSEEKRRW